MSTAPSGAGAVFGSQALNLGGHKIPYGFVAAGVGVIGLLLVLRARSTGGNVVAAGAAPPPVDATASGAGDPTYGGYQPYATMADLSTSIANLENAITAGQLTPPSAVGPGAPPADGGTTPGLPTPQAPTFWRDVINGAIYEVDPSGKRYLNAADWANVEAGYGGNAPFTNVSPQQLVNLVDIPGFGGPDAHPGMPRSIGIDVGPHGIIGGPVRVAS